MTKIKKMQKMLAEQELASRAEHDRLKAELIEAVKKTNIVCSLCFKASRLDRWEFIQETYSMDPESFARESEPNACNLICPKCGKQIRIFALRGKKKLLEEIRGLPLGKLFSKVTRHHRNSY